MRLLILLTMDDYITLAYSIMGVISCLGYAPQIWTLVVSKGRSLGTPISTWSLWGVEAIASLLYAVRLLKDPIVITFATIDVLAAFIIVGLTIYNRYYRYQKYAAL